MQLIMKFHNKFQMRHLISLCFFASISILATVTVTSIS